MSIARRFSPYTSRSSRRIPVLAAASALVAAASVTVTLAVAAGGADTASPAPSGTPAVAQPDRATLYRYGLDKPQAASSIDSTRAADRFHHR
jgi:hypothetical protein